MNYFSNQLFSSSFGHLSFDMAPIKFPLINQWIILELHVAYRQCTCFGLHCSQSFGKSIPTWQCHFSFPSCQGVSKPFPSVIKCNIGDAHAMGQKPMTFLRQVSDRGKYPRDLSSLFTRSYITFSLFIGTQTCSPTRNLRWSVIRHSVSHNMLLICTVVHDELF